VQRLYVLGHHCTRQRNWQVGERVRRQQAGAAAHIAAQPEWLPGQLQLAELLVAQTHSCKSDATLETCCGFVSATLMSVLIE
jgi:hypothetical protein